MVGRRRHQVEDQQPLSPEDDPYLAYLLWREEREAEAAAADGASPDGTALDPPAETDGPVRAGLRSWFGRLSARRHVNSAEPDRPGSGAGAGAA